MLQQMESKEEDNTTTLVELLVIIAGSVILASISIPQFTVWLQGW